MTVSSLPPSQTDAKMGKEGDLWDDSALINAFDQAISTYKIMHSSKNKDSSAVAERVISGTGEDDSNNDSENLGTRRDADEKRNVPANTLHSGETSYVSYLEENHNADTHAAQPCLDSTSGQNTQDAPDSHNSYPYAQGLDEYNHLVGQYYELEEKRQKILEQLNNYGGWNYQYTAAASNSGVPYSSSQDYSKSSCQLSHPNVLCSCCPCFSQCPLAPCTSVPCCSLGGICVGKPCNDDSVATNPDKLASYEDDKILKTAMGAAERAMSTIRTTVSGDSNVKKEKERNHFELDQSNGSETDLTVVLNAWYSAGFYTGKYLAEQSIANRRQG